MRTWKILNLYCSDEELEDWLNDLEREGKQIKEILREEKFTYKIIYTMEDINETSN
jgi:hypothetical protein